MSILARVIKAAIEGDEILLDDIHAVKFDGFISGFQIGFVEGRKLERENREEKEISKKDLCKHVETALDLIADKREKRQADLETFCKAKGNEDEKAL